MMSARIAVIGGGTIGGIAAGVLAGLGHEVILCVRRPLAGLIVELGGEARQVPARIAVEPAREEPVDWVLVATKAQDTAGAAPWLDSLAGSQTVVAVLQNGIDQIERVGALLRQGRVLPTIVYSSGNVVRPGHICAAASHRYVVPAGAAGAEFARLFDGGVIKIEPTDDFVTASWRKFLANTCVNPITALTMSRIRVMRDPEIRQFAKAILIEAVEVARAAGAVIPEGGIEALLDSFAAHDPEGGSSMYYDRLAGRSMEHEHLSGALVREAARYGIDVPVNRAVLALLRAVDASRLQPSPQTN